MSTSDDKAQLRAQLADAQETIKALNDRLRLYESSDTQLPFQKQLQSYQQRIEEKSAALQKSESWFERIVQSAMDAIVRLDVEGKIQSWNPAAEQMFGYSKDEILGLLIEDTLLPKRLHSMHLNNFHRHLKRGRGALMNRRLEGMAQCKNGSELPVEFVGSVVRQGDDLGYAMLFRDITERKAAEQAIHDSHANLEELVKVRTRELRGLAAVIEANINFVGIASLRGEVHYVNPAGRKMIGLAEDAPVDRLNCRDFHSPETCRLLADKIFPQTLEQGVFETECELVAQDGTTIPTASIFMSLPDEEGQPERLAVIARDLREEIALHQQIEHVDRLESLGVLAGGIAHDFNNILTVIIGSAEIAAGTLDASSPAKEHLQRIEKSSFHAANLCKQMLAYSGKASFIIQPVDLSFMISEMLSLLEVSVDKKIVLKVDLCKTLPAVDVDITQIQQIIMNLVINASEAIGKQNGTIVITTGMMQVDEPYLRNSLHKSAVSAGSFVYLEVSDSGCGMDADTQKKIFDPFFTTKFTGRGLGMSAVLGIVNGHHGLLNLHSEPGKGTTFKIALPISASSEIPISDKKKRAVPSRGSGMVLVVDDEEGIRETASIFLENMGYIVITAVDGEDGIELFRQHQQELIGVILDMTMPHMNGEECYIALQEIDPDVRVILSSGYSEEDATDRFHAKGLIGFIQKPYRIDHFQKVVFACFASR